MNPVTRIALFRQVYKPVLNMNNNFTLTLRAVISCFILSIATLNFSFSQVRLVEDIDTSSGTSGEGKEFHSHESDGVRSFFVSNGGELWTSDGTTVGTKMIRRFLRINEIEVIGGTCFLNVLTEDHGFELWRSNGTAGGTVLVKDIYPGRGNSTPQSMTNVNGTLFFSANHPAYGRELWKSDGTAAGTQLVKDIASGNESGTPRHLVNNGGRVFFSAITEIEGEELWSSDGTASGTALISDIIPGPVGSSPGDLTASNGWVFFSANESFASRQLWKSNGTAGGTVKVEDINPGGHAFIGRMIDVQGIVFFQAYEEEHGLELWRSDGTAAGTFLLKDFTPGPGSEAGYASYHLDRFASINGKLAFIADTGSQRIWISDGTPAGTIQATYPGGQPILYNLPSINFHEINGSAYFQAIGEADANLYRMDMNGNIFQVRRNTGGNGFLEEALFARIGSTHYFITGDYFWKTDGSSSGTTPIRTLGIPSGADPSELIDVNGTLYFSTWGPNEVWKSNGTAETTDKFLGVGYVEDMVNHNDQLLISGNVNGQSINSLFRSDGTTEGTYALAPQMHFPANFTKGNGVTFFSGNTSSEGSELWRTDGTPQGTQMVKDINPGPSNSGPRQLTAVGSHLYFVAFGPSRGYELFRTNGFDETYMVKDIFPGLGSSAINNLVSFKGKLFFQADDGVNGYELWQSNGSNTFTTMVKNIRASDTNIVDMGTMIATNDHLFFSALNEAGVMSLWKSDGTSAGTVQMMTFNTNAQYPEMLASIGSQAFFLVRMSSHMELWRTNGTSTVRLANFRNQDYFGYGNAFQRMAVKGNTVYFITDYYPQRFLWRSDGTFSGTYQILFDGNPTRLCTSGNHVYLSGTSQKQGAELFVIEEATSVSAETLVAVQDQQPDVLIKNYPNPFEYNFKLLVPGAADEVFHLNVIDMQGRTVSAEDHLPCNIEHQVGASWKPGIYVIQVKQNDKLITRKIIKATE
jgi:ELWxxDGT repeat protein